MSASSSARIRHPLLVLLLAVSAVAGCTSGDGVSDPDDPPDPVATTVTVSPGSTTLEAGGRTAQLTATVRDQSGDVMADAPVIWTSAPSQFAAVDSDGLVTSGSQGEATVTATSGDASGTAEVMVIPRPVVSIQVTPSAGSIAPGGTVQLDAVARDASGQTLSGRTVTWSSSNAGIAGVSSSGLVTGVSVGGPVTVTATAEGVSGTAVITVTSPVESVTLTGRSRVKVGDTYQYTATARSGDGTILDRPMTWSVAETARGTMTPNGTLTPHQSGEITLRVTIDGEVWQAAVEAYDWTAQTISGSLYIVLHADTPITNQFGTSELAEMVFVCSSTGSFLMWVDTENFVTANGGVAYSFDEGTIFTQTWLEFDSFSALGHPGPTNAATKSFALDMAQARTFEFGFGEYQSEPRVMGFRVTGMSAFLQPLLNACPSNAVREPGAGAAKVAGAIGAADAGGAEAPEDEIAGSIAGELANLREAYRRAGGEEAAASSSSLAEGLVQLRSRSEPSPVAPVPELDPGAAEGSFPATRRP